VVDLAAAARGGSGRDCVHIKRSSTPKQTTRQKSRLNHKQIYQVKCRMRLPVFVAFISLVGANRY
jgi:hypothetical protein